MTQILSLCPGCGFEILTSEPGLDDRFNASRACRALYDELSGYTLSLNDPDFIHQYVVDAYAASHSGEQVKPITTIFALVGLYLGVERGYTGRQVQKAHMLLAKRRQNWPRFELPPGRPRLTVQDVLESPAGPERNEWIPDWVRAVWEMWDKEHQRVEEFAESEIDIG